MTPPDPARAARLTAIAERLDKLEQLTGQSTEHGDVRFLLAHVETLTQQVAMVTGTSSSIYAAGLLQRAERAEQQRDTAHAALREIKADIRWQSGAHYEGCNCTFCTVIAKTDAALAASAPPTTIRARLVTAAPEEPLPITPEDSESEPAPAQETERGR